ncbi:NAD-dependent epimerase/dehydratase family protein [Psychrobacillus glaciei]|uniref:NAD-dependent epimerase/dehydratase family protein n=1 Tax=Psychrobacillus glaciei TaxID=2283160 RepID=A0A5J6SRS7_9BACI|nr:polysaccharide biosynthesis protein [Psychrobacillus glaciei]QFG00677.1 NAD-dependent epimerase/dehydratase family protein [Psychrobacillus glaciei]
MFTNSTILVTGGTGSWGNELIKQLLSMHPKKIIIFSRNENRQVTMRRNFPDTRIQFCIGDIRDRDAISTACSGVDYVFHLAALKHVTICEENPIESFKTNVLGTYNVIEASIENNVKKVIYVSTDKAADPANTYGMTKALGEKLMIHANKKNTTTKFLCIRGGNVLGSSGSVLLLFMKQIEEQNQIIITDRRMTRYFVTPQYAIKTLLQAAELGNGGEVFVMHMNACKILDLAEVLIDYFQKKDVDIIEIGARNGEKMHEALIAQNEVPLATVFNKDLILISSTNSREGESSLPPVLLDTEQRLMTKTEIRELLTEGGYLK